jgi:hydroxymethylbilane synthase
MKIGTRGSPLALWQAEHVRSRLSALGHQATIEPITTTGDRITERLETVGGKGVFLKEIEDALLGGLVDLAVHSLKDVPTGLPDGLVLCTLLERADPRDALVSSGLRLAALPAGATLGTTSLRRRALVRAARPDLVLQDLRGNVDTRLRRLHEGRFDAILLAMAGLGRLGHLREVTEVLDPFVFIPAPGQGAIALECRSDDARIQRAVRPLHHAETALAVAAERAFLAALGGGCNVPLGAYALTDGDALRLRAFVAGREGAELLRAEGHDRDPVALGRAVADDLISRGADRLLGS